MIDFASNAFATASIISVIAMVASTITYSITSDTFFVEYFFTKWSKESSSNAYPTKSFNDLSWSVDKAQNEINRLTNHYQNITEYIKTSTSSVELKALESRVAEIEKFNDALSETIWGRFRIRVKSGHERTGQPKSILQQYLDAIVR